MRNIKLLAFAFFAALSTSVWADKTYTFDDGVALETDWNVELTGEGLTCKITDNIGGSLTKKDGNYMGFAFTKSNTTITVTTKAAYTNITAIGIDLSANDNSKPSYSGYIVDDNGNVVETLFENIDSKNSFATGGAKKWGHKDTSVSSKTGHFRLSATTGSSGKYTAIDNITITYSAAPVTPTVNSVTVSPASATLDPNGTQQLTANVDATPASADKSVTWSSSNPSVATVSESGLVTAVAQGTATITATSNLDNTKSGTCSVTVNAPAAPIPVTAINLNKSTATIYVGSTETLTVSYTPADANTGKAVNWTSNNTGVATVDANGTVTAVAVGTAVITATSTTDASINASCTVTVDVAHPTGVTLNKSSLNLQVGGNETLTATVVPANASDKSVTWSSSNTNVATVSNGKVSGVAAGTATITVTTVDGNKTATCTVTVTAGPQVPQTGLTLHVPEIYEAKEIAGGYGTPLTAIDGHEYEVYYTEHTDKTKYPTFSTTPVEECKTEGISGSTSETKNEGREGDKWFEGTIASTSECKSASSKDEFVFASKTIREHRLGATDTYQFHVKGFDQFSLWGMDKKIDPKNGNQVFVVTVDGKEQPTDESLYNKDNYTIRRYDITTNEHLIEISTTCSGSNVCYMGGFSLRVAQEPRTKWLKGNDSTQKVNAFGTINPITYVTKYNNIAGAETKLEWLGTAVDGIALQKIEGDLTDTLILSGTANAPIGEYKYAVVAYYNGVETSRAEGKFKVKYEIKAITEADVEADQGEEMDAIKCRYYVYDATTDIIFKWINGLDAPGVTTSAKNGIYTIGGTPTTVGTYHYLVTVTGGDTIMGTISVKSADLGVNPILYLYKNTFAYEKDYVYTYLKNSGYNLREKKAKDDLRPANQYAKYKWILISEDVDANNPEVYKILRGGSHLPVLNMNAFSYAHPIDSLTPEYGGTWGEPNNGSLSENGKSITVLRDDHPIFSKMHKKQGDQIQVLDSIDRKGLMPIKVNKQGSLCLATALTRDREDYYGDGERETFLHEIPAGLDGNNTKYICFPLSMNSSKYMTAEGKNLLNAVIAYLTNEQEASVERPELRITEFKLGDIEIIPEIGSYSIMLEIDTLEHPELADLSAVTPEITLASEYTHTIPAQGEPVNLSIAEYLPFEYVVSDYIHREVYEITVVYRKPQGIEDVYTAGEWVNIFDIYGRKVTTTNEDIYSMPLPRGMYIVVTANGQTLKIMR